MGDNRAREAGYWYADEPSPAPGSEFVVGNPTDWIAFRVEPDNSWSYAHNRAEFRPCTVRFANFWAPLRITKRVAPAVKEPNRCGT